MTKQPDRTHTTIALAYDLVMQGPELMFLGPQRRKIQRSVRGLILEIGAGTGLSLRYYEPGATVVATDNDLASIFRLAKKANRATARVLVSAADARELPFGDHTFDGAVCSMALCTIPDPMRALGEIGRVLKPGAPARFLEHVRSESAWQAWVQDRLAPAWARGAGGCRLNQDTERLIRASGLEVETVEKRGGLILPMRLVWTHRQG